MLAKNAPGVGVWSTTAPGTYESVLGAAIPTASLAGKTVTGGRLGVTGF